MRGTERTGPEDRRKAKQRYKKGLVGKENAEEILWVRARSWLQLRKIRFISGKYQQ